MHGVRRETDADRQRSGPGRRTKNYKTEGTSIHETNRTDKLLHTFYLGNVSGRPFNILIAQGRRTNTSNGEQDTLGTQQNITLTQ